MRNSHETSSSSQCVLSTWQLTTLAAALGIRRVVEQVTGVQIPRTQPIPKEHIESIRMGTTVATNGTF